MSGLARTLRANSSQLERRTWRLLHTFRTGGYHFRKQSPIGPYVADFACHHAKLVIEMDGETHFTDDGLRHDACCDAFLRSQGYTVLRFTNHEVATNPDGVFEVIAAALADRPLSPRAGHPLPNPPHKGEGAAPSGDAAPEPHLQPDVASISPQPPEDTSPLVGEVGRGGTASEVPFGACVWIEPPPPADTLPPAGRVGEGGGVGRVGEGGGEPQ